MPFSSRPFCTVLLAVVLVFTASSCHKKAVAVPVPSQPAAQPAEEVPAPVTPAEPVVTAPPPVTTPAPIQTQPAKDESKYQKNKPAEQPPPPKRAARPATTPPPSAPAAPATAAPVEPPHLGDILTPDQQHQFNSAIDVRLAHAQASLDYITTRQLTREQEATVVQIQNFMAQAQEKRKDDLAAADSLAERAEVLSHDLVASLRK